MSGYTYIGYDEATPRRGENVCYEVFFKVENKEDLSRIVGYLKKRYGKEFRVFAKTNELFSVRSIPGVDYSAFISGLKTWMNYVD